MIDMPVDRVKRMHEAYVASLPALAKELRAEMPADDAAKLDGTIESLDFVNEWYLNELRRADVGSV